MKDTESDKKNKIETITTFLLSIIDIDLVGLDKETLKLLNDVFEALEYRFPEDVTEYIRYPDNTNRAYITFEICPKCGTVLSRSYQEYCSTCGQRLRWIAKSKMKIKPRTTDL